MVKESNTLNVLDGSMQDSNVASNPDGGRMVIDMLNATLAELGIADIERVVH